MRWKPLVVLCLITLPVLSCAASVRVTVSTPANNATVNSPTLFAASATANITGWRIYVDGTSVYTAGATKSISTNISMAPGTHQVVVRAWANNGSYGSVYLTETVSSTTPAGTAQGSLTPTSLAFGSVTANTTSSSQAVTIKNTGTANLNITGVSISPSQFVMSGPTSTSLAPGSSYVYTVTFSPTAASAYSGTLAFSTNSATVVPTVALSGTGVTASAEGSASPTSVAFGSETTGTTSAAKTVTLTNTGNATLNVSGVATSASQFSVSGPTSTSIAPGSSAAYSVTFTPTAATSYSGSLSFTTNSANAVAPVSLSGTGATASTGLAADCTLFASPSGSDTNSGTTATAPKTLTGAANAAYPGDVVCLEGGTYNRSSSFIPPRGGTATAYITYKGYGDSPATLNWTGTDYAGNWVIMVSACSGCSAGQFGTVNYLKFINFTINGNNTARSGIGLTFAHHMVVQSLFIENTGEGVDMERSDYMTVDHNLVWHTGYDTNLTYHTSGISLNTMCSYDSYSGLHNIVTNNIVSGTVDEVMPPYTDGNGISYDLGCNGGNSVSTANSPPALFANNVLYMNGGRCIVANYTDGVVIANNTCYKNLLINAANLNNGNGEFDAIGSYNVWFTNNIALGWPGNSSDFSYDFANSSYNIYYNYNSWLNLGLSSGVSTGTMYHEDPLFVNPPAVDNSATGQYTKAPSPQTIGSAFQLQSVSPAINQGVDPTTVSGLPSSIANDMKKYVYTNILGQPRPAGGPFNLGAY